MTADIYILMVWIVFWSTLLIFVIRKFENKLADLQREMSETKLAAFRPMMVDSTQDISETRITVRDGFAAIGAQLVILNRKLESLVSEARRITTKVPQ